MASKRKSTTPCMVLASQHDPDVEVNSDVEEGPPRVSTAESPNAETPTLENEGNNEAALEPNVSDNQPSKIVEEHNMKHHPGEENFKLTMVKRNNQTIFEQTVNDLTFDGSFVQEENQEQSESNLSGISISKTPIMKIMKEKSEKKRISVPQIAAEEGAEDAKPEDEPKGKTSDESKTAPVIKEPVKTNATVIAAPPELPNPVVAPAAVLQPGLAQVITTVPAPQNILSKVLIPVTSIPTYNSALDNNPLLLSMYSKFPYPTVSEITLLATQTKCTEEQIKIWFSAQRLKHGVSWTPEEVEEARRKQFNGTVHTVPQTITVIPAQISSANGLSSILQTCQIVGQPSLVFTQVAGTSTLPITAPIALTVASVPSNAQLQASQIPQTHPLPETRKVATVPSPQLPKQEPTFIIDPFNLRSKKSKEQLSALKTSYLRNQYPHNSEIERLIRLTGLTKGEIKKWFSDTRYNQRNAKGSHGIHLSGDATGTIIIDSSDETNESPPSGITSTQQRRQSWNAFPDFTPQKFKEKSLEQVQALEESFSKSTVPSDEELNRLRVLTKLTKREIDAWFAERRKLMGIKEEPGALKDGLRQEIKEEVDNGQAAAFVAAKMGKKSPEQLAILKNVFIRTQWPTPEEYDKLVQETGLARSDIVGWFGDTRYAVKHNLLKWFSQYQESKSPGVVNGRGSMRKRGRGRPKSKGRGRPRGRPRGRRSNSWEKTVAPIKQKTGKALLKDYYLIHKFLNEEDLDDLVTKSRMGYEQVREWFAMRMQREDAGLDPFDDEEEEDDLLLDDLDDEEVETDDSDTWEPPKHVKRKLIKMEELQG